MAFLLCLVVASVCFFSTSAVDLTWDKSADFKPTHFEYANQYFAHAVVPWRKIPLWDMHEEYSLCPPGTHHSHKWFFQPLGSYVRMIAKKDADGEMFLMAGVKFRNNCLVLKNLTEGWLGNFYFAPHYTTLHRWVFMKQTPPPEPERLTFTSLHAGGGTIRLCPPLYSYRDGHSGSIRWHAVRYGWKDHEEFAYRYANDYRWFGRPHFRFEISAKRGAVKGAMTASACVDVKPRPYTFIYCTVSSDPQGNENIRRHIWFFQSPNKPLLTKPPRLGLMGILENPNKYLNFKTDGYEFLKHYGSMSDMEVMDKNIEIQEKEIQLCSRAPTWDRVADEWQWWSFIPHYSQSFEPHLGAIVSAWYFTGSAYTASTGIVQSGDHRCLIIKHPGPDVAGLWLHKPGTDKYGTRFWVHSPSNDTFKPKSFYRPAIVKPGEKNVWLCPSRHAQLLKATINIYLKDPVSDRKSLIFTRNDWYGAGYEYKIATKVVSRGMHTACVVIKEITAETLGTYKIEVTPDDPRVKKWTETVDLLPEENPKPKQSPPSKDHSPLAKVMEDPETSNSTNESNAPEPTRPAEPQTTTGLLRQKRALILRSCFLHGNTSETFPNKMLKYADNFFQHQRAQKINIPIWSMNKTYHLCPPKGHETHHQWYFKPADATVRLIAKKAKDCEQLFMPGLYFEEGCLAVEKLDAQWRGTFYFAPNYKTLRWWDVSSSEAHTDPKLVLTSMYPPATGSVRLCAPLSFYKDGFAGTIRWHMTGPGLREHFQIAYRKQADYYWFSYRYYIFDMEANSRMIKVSMTAAGCVDVAPSAGTFVYATFSSDPDGYRDIKRAVWHFAYPGQSLTKKMRLGLIAYLINPDSFLKNSLDGYRYKYTYGDMTSARFTETKTITLEKKDVKICAQQYFPEESSWFFFPHYIKDLQQHYGKLILHRSRPTYKTMLASSGLSYEGDYRCIIIRHAGADMAGTLVYVPDVGSHGSVLDKEGSKFILEKPVEEKDFYPKSLHRTTPVRLGDTNVWLCPSRHAQVVQGEILLYLEDPISQQKVLVFKRNEWHSPIDFADFGQRHYYAPSAVDSLDDTACVVIKEVNGATMGTYRYTIHQRNKDTTRTWTEIIDFVPADESKRHKRDVTKPEETPEVVRKPRSLCVGCSDYNSKYNTKFLMHNKQVILQGFLDDRFKAENCSMTWVDPSHTPLVTVINGTAFYHHPEKMDPRYHVLVGTGGFMIERVQCKDEGVWVGYITCPNHNHSIAVLTKLVLVDSVETVTGEPFKSTESRLTYVPGKTGLNITQNGHRPECFRGPEPRCEYLPETDQIRFNLFQMEDTGLWVLNYTIQDKPNYIRLMKISIEAPKGCFVPSGRNRFGKLDAHWQYQQQSTIIWSKQIKPDNETLKPVCIAKGGYSVRSLMKNHTCTFSGQLDAGLSCGLYWAYAFKQHGPRVPTSISAHYIKCSPEDPIPHHVCLPVGTLGRPGVLVESPYPKEAIINHTVINTHRASNDSATRQICFAESGHTMWNRSGVDCFFDGAFKISNRFCGMQYTFGYDHRHFKESVLRRHLMPCPRSANPTPEPIIRHKRSLVEEDPEENMVVPVMEDTKDHTITTLVDFPETESHVSIMLEHNTTAEVTIVEAMRGGDFIVVPIVNSTATTGIILASLFILLLFFLLWLYCKWKKSQKASADYEMRAPLYVEK